MSASDPIRSSDTEPYLDDPPGAPARSAPIPPAVAVTRGIYHCRVGEWHSGLHYFRMADDLDATLPGLYYSYKGVALARCERRHAEAIELCEHAVAIEFFDPENFLNLATVRLMAGDRQGAMVAVARGLALDARHAGLLAIARRLGERRRPVLGFLPREHPLNRRLGRLRHGWLARHGRA